MSVSKLVPPPLSFTKDLHAKIIAVPCPRKPNVNAKCTVPTALKLSPELQLQLQQHLDTAGLDYYRYEHDTVNQDQAFDKVVQLGIHIPDAIQRDVRTKFSIRHRDSTPITGRRKIDAGKTWMPIVRLYQCLCGTTNEGDTRQIPWPDVGCMCWVRVVTTHDAGDLSLLTIDEISGALDHSAACDDTNTMIRNPPMALEPNLRIYALSLVKDHIPKTQIQQLCRTYAESRWPNQAGNHHYRYLLSTHETSSLYHTAARDLGIPQRSAAEDNLDRWFRSTKPQPPIWTGTTLTDSCLYYEPCVDGISDRFIIILATPQQRALGWKHGHRKQLLMDLTFGTCSARALTGILMVLDDDNKGIPVAFFKFTARKEAKATHADYDGKLLEKLLRCYKSGMGKNHIGEEFDILVANTDNDARERNALAAVFPGTLLLLCMFHVWQAWRNGLNKHLRAIPQGPSRQEVRHRLGRFLMRQLKEIEDYDEAITSFNNETRYFTQLSKKRDQLSKKKAQGALAFLVYFQSYVKLYSFWKAWSRAGVLEASHRLKILVDKIPRTTNHLESFNGRLKKKYYAQYQHGGRLPRIDIWILVLIMNVMPCFFTELANQRAQATHYQHMRQAIPKHSDTSIMALPLTPTGNADDSLPLLVSEEKSIEHQILTDLSIDDEADSIEIEEEDHELKDLLGMEGYGQELVVDHNGDDSRCHPTLFVIEPDMVPDQEDETADALDQEEPEAKIAPVEPDVPDWEDTIALDEHDILPNLPSNGPQQTSQHVQNAQATCMQELLVVHDTLVTTIHRLLDLGVSLEILSEHITPSCRNQLGLALISAPSTPTTPNLSESGSSSRPESPRSPSNSSHSISPSVELLPLPDPIESTSMRAKKILQAFAPQKKEKRKLSHGIR